MSVDIGLDDRELREAKLLVATDPRQALELALSKSATHKKVIAHSMKDIPELVAAMAIGMFAREIQETDFKMALRGSGHLRVDDDQLDALHALAAVGCEFYAKHPLAKQHLLVALPALGKWLDLALDTILDDTHPRSARRGVLQVVKDAVSSLRDIGDEGRLFMGQREYWRRIIVAWLAVEDSSIEEDVLLSGLLATSRSILMEEKGDDANFPDEILVLGNGELRETKANNVIRIALGRIRRAMSVFMTNGEDAVLALHLGVFHYILLSDPGENGTHAFEHPLHVALRELDGMGVVKGILSASMWHSKWTTVSLSLGIVFCHLSGIRSSDTLKKSLEIGLVELLWEASKHSEQLNDIGRASITVLIRELLPESLILRSVVKGCDLDELRSSTASILGDDWANVFSVHEDRKSLYQALVRRNGKEKIRCGNPRCSMRETNLLRFKTCAKCQLRFYCSRACHVHAWNEAGHRAECQSICGIIDTLKLGVLHSDIKYLLRTAHDDAQRYLDETKEIPTSTQALFVHYTQVLHTDINQRRGVEPVIDIMDDIQVPESVILPDLQFHYRCDFSCRIQISFSLCGETRFIWTHSGLHDPAASGDD
ncbi:hypothetical protein SCHPADRAFT_753392 [Schizopora paradoxa]|uniref:MYND-type domain-containing protein n=1 Tax=Schizopora paradoxa TaxID=27342 RepID=A0A0H2RI23_9AGAM|nr:hypothetical protein SCHPADRAFT_753392 [Schizopora paradoxa]